MLRCLLAARRYKLLKHIGITAVVVPEGKLIQVQREVFFADMIGLAQVGFFVLWVCVFVGLWMFFDGDPDLYDLVLAKLKAAME